MVFHVQARALLTVMFGGGDGAVEGSRTASSLSQASRAAFPAAAPRVLIPASAGKPAVLRVRQPQERHPHGRSSLSWNRAERRTFAVIDEPASGGGNRLYNLLYPLHTGVLGGLPLRLLWLLCAPLAFVAIVQAARGRISAAFTRMGTR